jgi:hypothetical protein
MKQKPTSSAALVAVNEAKAWRWDCGLNRKEEVAKLDLATHRASIAGVPSCRSIRRVTISCCNRACNLFLKAFTCLEGARVPVYGAVDIDEYCDAIHQSPRLLAASLPPAISMGEMTSNITPTIIEPDNLIARVAVVLQHASGCLADTLNAQLFRLHRREEIALSSRSLMCKYTRVSDAAIVDRARISYVRCGRSMLSDCCIDAARSCSWPDEWVGWGRWASSTADLPGMRIQLV